jgi:putative CocE/NonD family hydrolase
MTIGPWVHMGLHDDSGLAAVEHLRWYDYWLKGIENGIMDEPPVYYYTMGAGSGRGWHFASDWPVPGAASRDYYFAAGPSGSAASGNDGVLAEAAPSGSSGGDVYRVEDFTLSLMDRWSAVSIGDVGLDFTALDEASLTYTTAPLSADTVITGYPVVHLWVSCSAADADFFVYLVEVDGAGKSVNMSDGLLRASHRSVNTPPWDNMGLPWHRSYSGDVAGLTPGQPAELAIALSPISNIFDRGHRIRVTVTCTDYGDMFDTPRGAGAEVTVYHNGAYASYISLPAAGAA